MRPRGEPALSTRPPFFSIYPQSIYVCVDFLWPSTELPAEWAVTFLSTKICGSCTIILPTPLLQLAPDSPCSCTNASPRLLHPIFQEARIKKKNSNLQHFILFGHEENSCRLTSFSLSYLYEPRKWAGIFFFMTVDSEACYVGIRHLYLFWAGKWTAYMQGGYVLMD